MSTPACNSTAVVRVRFLLWQPLKSSYRSYGSHSTMTTAAGNSAATTTVRFLLWLRLPEVRLPLLRFAFNNGYRCLKSGCRKGGGVRVM